MKCPACQALATRYLEWTWRPKRILFLVFTSFWDANQLELLKNNFVSYTHDVTWNNRCVLSLMWAHITKYGHRRWGTSNTMLGSPCITFTVSSGLISSPTAVSPHVCPEGPGALSHSGMPALRGFPSSTQIYFLMIVIVLPVFMLHFFISEERAAVFPLFTSLFRLNKFYHLYLM